MCRLQMSILAVPMIRTLEDNKNWTGACSNESSRSKRSLIVNSHEFMEIGEFSHVILPREIKAIELNPTEPINYENEEDFDLRRIELFSGRPFRWSPFIRGQLISAYAWGNVPGNFLGGILSQRFGPRQAILWSSIIAAAVSLFTPILAQLSWIALAGSRIVIGLTAGVTFPACHNLVAKWSPPNEKNRFIWTLQGGTFGSIFLFAIISGIAEGINWECGWYLPALMMMVWIVFWWLFAYDSPEEHPGITEKEKNYIIE